MAEADPLWELLREESREALARACRDGRPLRIEDQRVGDELQGLGLGSYRRGAFTVWPRGREAWRNSTS